MLAFLNLGCASPSNVPEDEAREPTLHVIELRCEYLENPLGIDVTRPRLSWKLAAVDPDARGLRQSAYRVLVASRPEILADGKGDLWDSGRVESSRTTHVEWEGVPLRSRMMCYWKACSWDGDGARSEWSEPARFSMGLLDAADWGARWIGASRTAGPFGDAKWIWYPKGNPLENAPPGHHAFRTVQAIPAGRSVTKAEMLISADNAFALAVNGTRIAEGDRWEEPILVDLRPHLREGENVLAVGVRNEGEQPSPAGWIAHLRIELDEGEPIVRVTDSSWWAGSVRSPDWMSSPDHPAGWMPVRILGPYGIAPWGKVLGDGHSPDPWLRRSFDLTDYAAEALACVASLGYHELWVNGTKVGDHVLTPSISDLSKRARYVTYDIRDYLYPGRNTVALWLGGGWAHFPTFGCEDKPLVMARIDVTGDDGSTARVVTDESWKVHPSHRTLLGGWRFGRFGGERVDAGAQDREWNESDFDDSEWAAATPYDPEIRLSAEMIEPNRLDEKIAPRAIEELEDGGWRVDMGRNYTGWTELYLRGEPGATVTLTFSEREDEECTYDQRSELVLDEGGEGLFRHRFNYATGRWITVRGAELPLQADDITGGLVRNGYRCVGRFACSDGLLNRIYETVLWTYQCLSLGGYVVDCPHRERQGYGGDAHATMETALASFEKGAFFTKWMQDWRDVQSEDGDIPYTAPTYEGGGGPAWSGVCIALPWEVYLAYGDTWILEENYPMMQRWLRFLDTQSEGDILHRYGHENWGFLGDWVPPGRQQGSDGRVDERSTSFFNNCYRFYSVKRMAEIAEILGRMDDAAVYRERAEVLRRVVHEEYFDPETATYANGEQPYLAFPLLAGLTPPEHVPAVMANLERKILQEREGHVNSGIHGTYFLLKWLTETGRQDLVHEMVSKTDYPSWGHMLEEGATTIWEQWDGLHSRCHSSFLSVGAWFMEGVAGIRPDPARPGYEHFFIVPALVGDLTWARASLDSIRGLIASSYEIEGNAVTLSIEIPPNTSATVFVPADDPTAVTESGMPAGEAVGVRFLRHEEGAAVYEVVSGSYLFESKVAGLMVR